MEQLPLQLPPELANTPITEWQLNAVTITLGVMIIGRVWSAIKSSGGLVGIWKSLVFGSVTTTTKKD